MSGPVIAVIGSGFSGTMTALHLLERTEPTCRILLVERAAEPGLGQAYRTRQSAHLLNVRAHRMSAFGDRPEHFVEWLRARPECAGYTPADFVPRRLFGAYLCDLLAQARAGPHAERLMVRTAEARSLAAGADGFALALADGRRESVGLAVLATGNLPPAPPATATRSLLDGSRFAADPWSAEALADIPADASVLLIGTGLTAMDIALSLLEGGHRGVIHALSRRGLLPRPHAPIVPVPPGPALPTCLSMLLRTIRAEVGRAEAAGSDWVSVMDGLRPYTSDLWMAFSPAERARFLRHLRPWWDVHRHRMAEAVAERIAAARSAGQLDVRAGRIQALRDTGEAAELTWRPRGKATPRTELYARVINCAGPRSDYERLDDPLLRGLLDAGLVRPDPLRLGLDVTPACAVRDRDGAVSRRLFAVGPITRGVFWEMTAVPDLRHQCAAVAAHVAGIAAGLVSRRGPVARTA